MIGLFGAVIEYVTKGTFPTLFELFFLIGAIVVPNIIAVWFLLHILIANTEWDFLGHGRRFWIILFIACYGFGLAGGVMAFFVK